MEVKIVTTPIIVGDHVWLVDIGGEDGGDYQLYPGTIAAVLFAMGKSKQWVKRFGARLKIDEGTMKLHYFSVDDLGVNWFTNQKDAEAERDRRNNR